VSVHCNDASFKIEQDHHVDCAKCEGAAGAGFDMRLTMRCAIYKHYQKEIMSLPEWGTSAIMLGQIDPFRLSIIFYFSGEAFPHRHPHSRFDRSGSCRSLGDVRNPRVLIPTSAVAPARKHRGGWNSSKGGPGRPSRPGLQFAPIYRRSHRQKDQEDEHEYKSSHKYNPKVNMNGEYESKYTDMNVAAN
jgi:hypothetical protein